MFKRDTAMEILMSFLDRKVKEAEEEITKTGILSDDKAIPLMLKTQFNHIAHLGESMDGEFGHMRLQFKEVEGQFKEVQGQFKEVQGQFKEVQGQFKEVQGQFKEVQKEMDERFKKVDKKFDEVRSELRTEIKNLDDKMERRFEHMEKRLDLFGRNVLTGFSALAALMTVFHFIR